MINKVLGSILVTASVYVYLLSQLRPNDPVFLFAASNTVVNAILLMLAAVTLWLSFKDRFAHWWSYATVTSLAILMSCLGLIGLFYSNFDYSFSTVLLPINYLTILVSGIVFSLSALTCRHQPAPAQLNVANLLVHIRHRWPKPVQPRPQSAFRFGSIRHA